MTVRNLELDKTIDRESPEPFSTNRLLIGKVSPAESFLRAIIKEFYPKSVFAPPRLKILLQPMEKKEGGLSEVELRAFKDVGEQAGGVVIKIYEGDKFLTDFEVMEMINSQEEEYD